MQSLWNTANDLVTGPLNQIVQYLPNLPAKKVDPIRLTTTVSEDMSHFIRIAGLSGAIAVSLGAYGSHVIRDDPEIDDRRKKAFEAGSRYHLLHTLALMGASKARFPLLTGVLLGGGIVLFCGPCYHYSITGNEQFRKFTPSGGIMLILGWLSFVL